MECHGGRQGQKTPKRGSSSVWWMTKGEKETLLDTFSLVWGKKEKTKYEEKACVNTSFAGSVCWLPFSLF